MFRKNAQLNNAPKSSRQRVARMAFATLLISGTALVGGVSPASAFYPPEGGGLGPGCYPSYGGGIIGWYGC